jgi:hypothetical protein
MEDDMGGNKEPIGNRNYSNIVGKPGRKRLLGSFGRR